MVFNKKKGVVFVALVIDNGYRIRGTRVGFERRRTLVICTVVQRIGSGPVRLIDICEQNIKILSCKHLSTLKRRRWFNF